ncbi:MAG: cytochrome c-type biogenesis protein, partial [Plesiomonas shigelloides]
DSNAIIAEDMRQKVYELMQQGYNKQQVVDYMVTRYGNFVTYDPPLTASTLILWLGPLLVLLGGAFIIFRQTAKRRTDKALVTSAAVVSEEQQQHLQRLLEENGKSAPNSHNEKNNNGEQP